MPSWWAVTGRVPWRSSRSPILLCLSVALRGRASIAGCGAHVWLLWPVLVRSILRQLTERRGWAKTDREPIADTPAARPAGPS